MADPLLEKIYSDVFVGAHETAFESAYEEAYEAGFEAAITAVQAWLVSEDQSSLATDLGNEDLYQAPEVPTPEEPEVTYPEGNELLDAVDEIFVAVRSSSEVTGSLVNWGVDHWKNVARTQPTWKGELIQHPYLTAQAAAAAFAAADELLEEEV